MLKSTDLEMMAAYAARDAANAVIETQTILQLMVLKGLVTPEEVSDMRGIVKKQPKYNNILQIANKTLNEMNEIIKFESLVEKSLEPNGRENLTKDEREFLEYRLKNIPGI